MIESFWYLKFLTKTDLGLVSNQAGLNISKYVSSYFPSLDVPSPSSRAPGVPYYVCLGGEVLKCRFQSQTRGGKRSGELRLTGGNLKKRLQEISGPGDLIMLEVHDEIYRSDPDKVPRLKVVQQKSEEFENIVENVDWFMDKKSVGFSKQKTGLYTLVPDESLSLAGKGILDSFEKPACDLEGGKLKVFVTRYERNRKLRAKCLEEWGYNCQVCGMNFEQSYGNIGKDFIHVHHLNPISCSGTVSTDPKSDLIPVCPNCHSMLHRGNPLFSINELKEIMKTNSDD